MVGCSVYGCRSTQRNMKKEELRFFSFTKSEEFRKLSIAKCCRAYVINWKNARICSKHFEDSDFEVNLKIQLVKDYNCHARLLRSNAVPKLQLHGSKAEDTTRDERQQKRDRKKLVVDLMRIHEENNQECSLSTLLLENESKVEEDSHQDVSAVYCENSTSNLEVLVQENSNMKAEIDELKKQLSKSREYIHNLIIFKRDMETNIKEMNDEITTLKKKLKESDLRNNDKNQILDFVSKYFSSGQVLKMIDPNKQCRWSVDDICHSVSLHTAGPRACRWLQKHNFPLPSESTLRRWMSKVEMISGIIPFVLKLMSTYDMSSKEKVCSLIFDEMKIRKVYEYDRKTDTLHAPSSYLHVIMSRGLFKKWKQSIYYNFDTQLTPEILFSVIRELYNIGFNIGSICNDMAPGNIGFWKSWEVTPAKPWFSHPCKGENIYVMADVPHSVKLVRNNHMDSYFRIGDKIITKNPLEELLNKTNKLDLNIAHKLKPLHIHVQKAARQEVKLATQLYSHTVSRAISRLGDLGLLKSVDWKECLAFVKLINHWFDLFNSRVPKIDSRPRMWAFGLAESTHNKIITSMKTIMTLLRVGKAKSLYPFQKGILMSLAVLPTLFDYLKKTYGITYLLTNRLNQDLLEELFGVLRSIGGLHDHPTAMEVQCRLRKYLLGRNERILCQNQASNYSPGSDCEENIIPSRILQNKKDVRSKEIILTSQVFSNIDPTTLVADFEEEESRAELISDIEYDGLENIAGFIAFKLRNKEKRTTPTPQQQPNQPSHQPSSQQQNQGNQDTCSTKSPSPTNVIEAIEQQTKENETDHLQHSPSSKPPPVQRAISLPPAVSETYRTLPPTERRLDYSQSERLPNRPKLGRSISRKDAIKNFIKKETATFFGVDENNQEDEQIRWLDRRKRLASRTYGPLKTEFRPSSTISHRRTLAEMSGSQTMPERLRGFRPDVLPESSDVPDTVEERWPVPSIRGKDSVARLTWNGLSYVVTTLTRQRPRPRTQSTQYSRSFSPGTIGEPEQNLVDDIFFEQPPTSPSSPALPDSTDGPDNRVVDSAALEPLEHPVRYTATPGWKRDPQHGVRTRAEHRREVGGNRIFSSLLDSVLDNSDRRQYGMGWVGRMFGRSMRRSVLREQDIKEQLDDMEDHRPMFTYWVSIVQILVLIVSLICYGFGPFGIDLQLRSSQVLVPSLALQQVDYMEPAHFWFGPRAADLIHLGAKFGPCMRIDDKIQQQIDKTRTKEKETACCIRNDDSGCVQSSRADCSNTISTWKKWTPRDAGPGGRISGSVCGLDPKYCDAPASVHPYEWPDDITKWPICRKTNTQFSVQKHNGSKDKSAEHMICEVIGHPCCIGIHGMCKITTREYCDFVRGNFHEEASLCSQVSCLDNVCGMIPFYFAEVPDQFYRLWTSLFLHAGILQLLLTLVIQYFLMRDLEKLTGSFRIAIIYLGSGMAGNLASAIFVPYRADVGPSGSHFGLLACLIVEVLNAWPMLKHPNKALCKLLSITFFLFLVGLMPWVDNYAHLFGFVFGFLLSYALLPFVTFGPYDRQKKIIIIWICFLSAKFLFICLILLFYIIPVYDCEVCSYFNCLPITREFCASQNINFKREEYIV